MSSLIDWAAKQLEAAKRKKESLVRVRLEIEEALESPAPGLPVYWWRPKNHRLNFGDELNSAIVKGLIGRRPARAEAEQKKLLAIGSVVHFATPEDHVWGTGVNGKNLDPSQYVSRFAGVHAVRGPLTREFLEKRLGIDCPEVFGDPGLLLPLLYPIEKQPTRDYIVIPHISEMDSLPKDPHHVLPTSRWQDVYRQIAQARFVVSSSLHGLILADALGIPARHLRISEGEPSFKYEDYYLGSGRGGFRSARSVSEALELGGEPPIDWAPTPLLRAFPREVFTAPRH